MRIDYAERARALTGTPFRPQGRGLGGLDCIGVVLAAFDIDPGQVRRDYALRGESRHELETELGRFFRRISRAKARPGDVLLMDAASVQMHLAIITRRGFVHAHAGLRRVVETPGEPAWPILATYRFRRRS